MGTNHAQLPVNLPKNQVNNYSQDGQGRYQFNAPSVPVYAPNSLGGPAAVEPLNPAGGWEKDGELTLSLRADDGDFGQAGTLYREVFDDGANARLLDTVTGAVSGVKNANTKERAIQLWTNVDAEFGAKLRANLGAGQVESEAEAANKVSLVRSYRRGAPLLGCPCFLTLDFLGRVKAEVPVDEPAPEPV